MKCLDGIQGPVHVVSGCCFNRKALYGFDPASTEDDDGEAPVQRSRWWFGKLRKRALRRTMSTVPLLDSEDTDELTEAGASKEHNNSQCSRRLPAGRSGLHRESPNRWLANADAMNAGELPKCRSNAAR